MINFDSECEPCKGTGADERHGAELQCADCGGSGEGVCIACKKLLANGSNLPDSDGHRRCDSCSETFETHCEVIEGPRETIPVPASTTQRDWLREAFALPKHSVGTIKGAPSSRKFRVAS